MSAGSDTLEALREQVQSQTGRITRLEEERAALITACQAVYAFLVEPNPKNGDPAPWDLVDNDHPIRVAANRIVDTLVSLGIEG